MQKRLITAALPYVNNTPHLGNIIGSVLSADVYARYCRLRGYPTLFVGGTDEYGTATEIKAYQQNLTPQAICDQYHSVHKEIYAWFNISFDIFGRTSCKEHTHFVQDIFKASEVHGVFKEHASEQFFDEQAQIFLADRFVVGRCPACAYEKAHGDQCDQCAKLLSPDDLQSPKSVISHTVPLKCLTQHLFFDLPRFQAALKDWAIRLSVEKVWSKNAAAIMLAWLKEGLKERSITRDLKWGVPVPKVGYEKKVFYVWFDAPIGYISITAAGCKDWQQWWKDHDVQLIQFMGKDNVPFHSIIFPAVLMASQQGWVLPSRIYATEYLNYEGDKFSKSRGVGIFGTDALESGIPADYWRYVLLSNRPEQQDANFTWQDFVNRIHGECVSNFGNLCHRVLTFLQSKLQGVVPASGPYLAIDEAFLESIQASVARYELLCESAQLKDALFEVMALSRLANKYFQDTAPWKVIKTDVPRTQSIIAILLSTLRHLMVLVSPFVPETALALQHMLGLSQISWDDKGIFLTPGERLPAPQVLFTPLEEQKIASMASRFSGASHGV